MGNDTLFWANLIIQRNTLRAACATVGSERYPDLFFFMSFEFLAESFLEKQYSCCLLDVACRGIKDVVGYV